MRTRESARTSLCLLVRGCGSVPRCIDLEVLSGNVSSPTSHSQAIHIAIQAVSRQWLVFSSPKCYFLRIRLRRRWRRFATRKLRSGGSDEQPRTSARSACRVVRTTQEMHGPKPVPSLHELLSVQALQDRGRQVRIVPSRGRRRHQSCRR